MSIVFVRIADIFGVISLRPFEIEKVQKWLPLNIFFLAMLVTGTKSLSLLTVPMVTIFKNVQTCVTAFGDWWFFSKTVSVYTLLTLMIMISGALVAGYNDLEYNFWGYVWVIVNCLCGSAYVLYTKLAMDTLKMEKVDNINYNCSLSLPFLLVFMFFNGELNLIYANAWDSFTNDSIAILTMNAIFAFGISFASFWVIQTTSPTTFSVLGAVNKIPLTLASIWWFGVEFSPIGGPAVAGSLSGGIIYAYSSSRDMMMIKKKEKDEKDEKKDKEQIV